MRSGRKASHWSSFSPQPAKIKGMPVPAVVIDVTPEAVTLAADHELAGTDLNFDIALVEVEG